MEQQKSSAEYIKLGIVLLFMFGFQFVPPIGPMTPYGMAVLGILIGAILGWSFDSKQMLGTSLIALVALAMVGYPGGIMAVYQKLMASESLLMMCLGMIMVGALVDAKIDAYIIAKVMNMKLVQGRPWLTTFLLVFSPCILGLLIMNTPLMLFLLPLYIKLFKGAGYSTGDKYVVNVFIGSVISAICSMYILPFKGIALAFSGMVKGYVGSMWTYAEFMMTLTITCLAISALYVVFMWIQRCDVSKVANLDLSIFGDPKASITKHQKAVLTCMIVYIVGSTIISFGGMMQNSVGTFLNSISVYGWMLVILGIMSIVKVDGKRLMNLNVASAKGFSWDLILMVGSATLIGGALTAAETDCAWWKPEHCRYCCFYVCRYVDWYQFLQQYGNHDDWFYHFRVSDCWRYGIKWPNAGSRHHAFQPVGYFIASIQLVGRDVALPGNDYPGYNL